MPKEDIVNVLDRAHARMGHQPSCSILGIYPEVLQEEMRCLTEQLADHPLFSSAVEEQLIPDVRNNAFILRAVEAAATRPPDIIIFRMTQGEDEQLDSLLGAVQVHRLKSRLVVITELDDPCQVWALLERGVDDFLTVPLKASEVFPRLKALLPTKQASSESLQELKERLGLQYLVGGHPRMVNILRTLPAIARSDATVLLSGETGTGKEVLARAIHQLGPRHKGPFAPLNCGAVPANLIENELFGHKAGAYTGANGSATGVVREAEGGTLFLDEVDSMPPPAQVKLLRFLQQKEFRSLGSAQLLTANVRVIAASNADLEEAIRSGQLRKDLYYRLNIVSIMLPPLRERRQDIPLLAEHFLTKYPPGAPRSISPGALKMLLNYDWPGNIRELENTIERALIFARGQTIRREDINLPCLAPELNQPSFKTLKARAVAEFEKTYLLDLLRTCHGNVTHAARAAQKNRRAFWELIRKHKLTQAIPRTPPTPPGNGSLLGPLR